MTQSIFGDALHLLEEQLGSTAKLQVVERLQRPANRPATLATGDLQEGHSLVAQAVRLSCMTEDQMRLLTEEFCDELIATVAELHPSLFAGSNDALVFLETVSERIGRYTGQRKNSASPPFVSSRRTSAGTLLVQIAPQEAAIDIVAALVQASGRYFGQELRVRVIKEMAAGRGAAIEVYATGCH